jgi:GntR family transcriptional regulator/MocR family aminotransferase
MKIQLERISERPLYLQIKDQLQERIESGSLLPGTKLPPSRTLAEELDVSRVTVVNAYAELEVEGLAKAHVGRGTFVIDPRGPDRDWRDNPFDWRTTLLRPPGVSASGMLADMLHLAQQPDLISFAMGAPATDLLPARPFREAVNRVLRRDGAAALQYDDASGYLPLRRAVVDMLKCAGVEARSADVLITSGSQQALDLAARVLTGPGDVVLTESPTYLGALDIFQSYGLEVHGVPMDGRGMRIDALEQAVKRHHPSLIYTITAFHNPTGTTMEEGRRRQLLELAEQHNVLILEDGVCSELCYEGSLPPSLKALDRGQNVVYVNSFSKFLLPGIRVGYMVASGRNRERLVTAKRATDLFTSSLLQRALFEYLEQGRLAPHLERVRSAYKNRRDAMLSALTRHLPEGAHWTRPQGGLCLWVTLPSSIATAQLYLTAIDHGVAFAVGSVFFPEHPASSSLRLNFAAHPAERIDEGLRRLGKALRKEQRSPVAVSGRAARPAR